MHETVPQSKPTPDYPLWICLFLKETLHVPGTGYGLGFENKMVSTAFQRNLQEHSKVYSNLQWQNCFEKKIKASKYIFDCFLFTQLLLIKPQLAWRARQMWRTKREARNPAPQPYAHSLNFHSFETRSSSMGRNASVWTCLGEFIIPVCKSLKPWF